MVPFSAYLSSRIQDFCPLTPLDMTARGPPSPPSASNPSPAKRARSEASEASLASSPSTAASSVFDSSSFCLSPVSAIRSILSQSPSSSPPLSRTPSRRSSIGAGCSKSVRFARCTNASVFPALSGDEYDRTPIVPTCESESLTLPKRECDGTEGWIKCVERARVAEKERKAKAAAAIAAGESPEPFKLTTTSHKVVEGVHGLVGGGYFVGDERGESAIASSDEDDLADDIEHDDHVAQDDEDDAQADDMVVDDEEDGGDSEQTPVAVPALIHDDSSDDSDSVPSVVSDAPIPIRVASPSLAVDPFLSSTPVAAVPIPTIIAASADVDIGDEQQRQAAAAAAELERKRKCRERYGICALGKYTRAEVFQSYDSLGGF